MGKEPNTVKSNLVGKFMDISERYPKLDFQPSDFRDESDSTILVRERSKGSKLESTFAKKTGTVVKETAHTVSILPEKSKSVKTFSKRDLACASSSQKDNFKNTSKRQSILSESTSTSEGEEPVRKQKKNETARNPELAIDLENEQRPNIIEISSGTTECESQPIGTSSNKQGIGSKTTEQSFPKIEQNAGNEQNIEKTQKLDQHESSKESVAQQNAMASM